MVNVWDLLELGDLIIRLKKLPALATVSYDFGGLKPTSLSSYRGYYEFLALGFTDPDKHPKPKYLDTVGELLAECQTALGKEFDGWKGGTYRMHEETPIWVDNPGYCCGTGIVDLESQGERETYHVFLITKLVDQ